MIGLAFDENFNNDILRGLLRRNPQSGFGSHPGRRIVGSERRDGAGVGGATRSRARLGFGDARRDGLHFGVGQADHL